MQESDFSDEEYFWLPIPKTLAYRYWLQFPGKNDEDFIRELPAIIEGALRAIAKMRQREPHLSPTKESQKQQPILLEQPYVAGVSSKCAKELYR